MSSVEGIVSYEELFADFDDLLDKMPNFSDFLGSNNVSQDEVSAQVILDTLNIAFPVGVIDTEKEEDIVGQIRLLAMLKGVSISKEDDITPVIKFVKKWLSVARNNLGR